MIPRLKPLLHHLRHAHSRSRSKPPIPDADVYTISGIPVEFPRPNQPYDTQLALMSEVISTLDRARRQGHSHALLESPAGIGKSLSLLCAALAWQRHIGNCPDKWRPSSTDPDGAEDAMRVPKIFFLSRTDSQLTQLIGEYKKTTYRVPMAVLASRKHYCINKKIRKKDNADEVCKMLMKDKFLSCYAFKNAKKVGRHPSIWNEVHNVKDLVETGRTVRGCPYFAAQEMASKAQLVFCPYSYIINPSVRKAMDIDIKGSIIILDEAHNIEDVSREAVSLDVDEEVLHNLQKDLNRLRKSVRVAAIYQPLYDMIKGITSWMADRTRNLQKRGSRHPYSKISVLGLTGLCHYYILLECPIDLYTIFSWTGDEAMVELQQAGITHQCFPLLQECATKAIKASSDAGSAADCLSVNSVTTLEGLVSSLSYLFTENGSHFVNYQLVLQQKYVNRVRSNTSRRLMNSFSLWCLNPAIVFKEIADLCLSVILTSGTLSPMSSFASELGVKFEACLEAPHVIDIDSQLWASVITSGPGNYMLNANSRNAYGYDFQDALGDSLEKICKVVPGGALVFFPSYTLMDSLHVRWSLTGQWSRLDAQKPIFVEPKNRDDCDAVVKSYKDSILGNNKVAHGKPTNRGAVLFAVCRGKVLEGIDFSDENARAVVIIGIPFPNINDIKVNLKRKYNDKYKSSKGLLNGGEWYSQQTFRAVNQAAGQCIRHRFDYGAIIFLDERFKQKENFAYTSKWLRNSIKQYEDFDMSIDDLQAFFENAQMKANERKRELSGTTSARVLVC